MSDLISQTGKKEYTFGHSSSATATHAARTVHSDAAFILPYIKPTDKILDVGCGPGSITYGFTEYVPEGTVTGVDYTPIIIEKAQAFALFKVREDDGKSRGKIEFALGNVLERLPFEDETFDIIFSSQVLTHLGDQSIQALKEMRRVLKKGGILSSRDGAMLHYHPPHLDLDRIGWENTCKAANLSGLIGPKMGSFYRAAGFDINGDKVKIGTGSNVVTGKASTRFHAESMAGRLEVGEAIRDSWVKAGISIEEIEKAKDAFREWGRRRMLGMGFCRVRFWLGNDWV